MLKDPKWDKKFEGPSFLGFVAWLERQPADGRYEWFDCANCVVGRYLMETTGEHGTVSQHIDVIMPDHENYDGRYGIIGRTEPWTYGAALERARKFLPATVSADA